MTLEIRTSVNYFCHLAGQPGQLLGCQASNNKRKKKLPYKRSDKILPITFLYFWLISFHSHCLLPLAIIEICACGFPWALSVSRRRKGWLRIMCSIQKMTPTAHSCQICPARLNKDVILEHSSSKTMHFHLKQPLQGCFVGVQNVNRIYILRGNVCRNSTYFCAQHRNDTLLCSVIFFSLA